ncbi:hypothetical protein LCGC14_0737850 [marine sediment metagenome]|uniref:Uncharacterized protein n=1 Tax=marine sediment metagenome TaxID=412755 RepID=A0A0F9QBT7_9ZZZZ
MENKKNYKRLALVFLIVIIILGLGLIWQTSMRLKYQMLKDEAIQLGAEGIITALQMVGACQELSNVTFEQIQEQVIHNYIYKNITEEVQEK